MGGQCIPLLCDSPGLIARPLRRAQPAPAHLKADPIALCAFPGNQQLGVSCGLPRYAFCAGKPPSEETVNPRWRKLRVCRSRVRRFAHRSSVSLLSIPQCCHRTKSRELLAYRSLARTRLIGRCNTPTCYSFGSRFGSKHPFLREAKRLQLPESALIFLRCHIGNSRPTRRF